MLITKLETSEAENMNGEGGDADEAEERRKACVGWWV